MVNSLNALYITVHLAVWLRYVLVRQEVGLEFKDMVEIISMILRLLLPQVMVLGIPSTLSSHLIQLDLCLVVFGQLKTMFKRYIYHINNELIVHPYSHRLVWTHTLTTRSTLIASRICFTAKIDLLDDSWYQEDI